MIMLFFLSIKRDETVLWLNFKFHHTWYIGVIISLFKHTWSTLEAHTTYHHAPANIEKQICIISASMYGDATSQTNTYICTSTPYRYRRWMHCTSITLVQILTISGINLSPATINEKLHIYPGSQSPGPESIHLWQSTNLTSRTTRLFYAIQERPWTDGRRKNTSAYLVTFENKSYTRRIITAFWSASCAVFYQT